MKNQYQKPVVIGAFVALLVGCGGGKNATPSASTAATASTSVEPQFERINGILVPPEPSASENSRTIEGVDLDKNGVRDDMDRWAAKKFGHVPAVVHPIYMVMRSEQNDLVSNPVTKDDAIALLRDSIYYGVCGSEVIERNGFDFGSIADEVALRTVNTRERINKIKAIRELAGAFFTTAGVVHKDCPHPQ